jgi:hypothetical protein
VSGDGIRPPQLESHPPLQGGVAFVAAYCDVYNAAVKPSVRPVGINIPRAKKICAREVVATHRLAVIPRDASNFLGCERAIPFLG